MKTTIYKAKSGWRAQSKTPFGTEKTLQLTTCKRSGGGIVSSLQVVRIEGDFEAHTYGRDYLAYPAEDHVLRCTEKTITDQHNRCVARLDEFKVLAEAHYVNQEVLEQTRQSLELAELT
jgi:hypothetical protein